MGAVSFISPFFYIQKYLFSSFFSYIARYAPSKNKKTSCFGSIKN